MLSKKTQSHFPIFLQATQVCCFIRDTKVLPKPPYQNIEINLIDPNYEITNRAVETNFTKQELHVYPLSSPSAKAALMVLYHLIPLTFKTFWTPDIKISEPGSAAWTAENKLLLFSLK